MPGVTETEFFERADMLDSKVGAGKKQPADEVAKLGFFLSRPRVRLELTSPLLPRAVDLAAQLPAKAAFSAAMSSFFMPITA